MKLFRKRCEWKKNKYLLHWEVAACFKNVSKLFDKSYLIKF